MPVQKATDADFVALLAEHERVVVKYYADWCGSCRLFAPKFKKMSDDVALANVTFLDVNAETDQAARKVAGVTNLPFFAAFRNGQLVGTVSATKEEAVRDLIGRLA
ncbi:MAG: thioredoxin [Hymenobacteraceae bacterium]|nr:thioredoxin [Hymenobacteraceae bacterium]